jgi:hypothetical protein
MAGTGTCRLQQGRQKGPSALHNRPLRCHIYTMQSTTCCNRALGAARHMQPHGGPFTRSRTVVLSHAAARWSFHMQPHGGPFTCSRTVVLLHAAARWSFYMQPHGDPFFLLYFVVELELGWQAAWCGGGWQWQVDACRDGVQPSASRQPAVPAGEQAATW